MADELSAGDRAFVEWRFVGFTVLIDPTDPIYQAFIAGWHARSAPSAFVARSAPTFARQVAAEPRSAP